MQHQVHDLCRSVGRSRHLKGNDELLARHFSDDPGGEAGCEQALSIAGACATAVTCG
jgi:hypothetical protein